MIISAFLPGDYCMGSSKSGFVWSPSLGNISGTGSRQADDAESVLLWTGEAEILPDMSMLSEMWQ